MNNTGKPKGKENKMTNFEALAAQRLSQDITDIERELIEDLRAEISDWQVTGCLSDINTTQAERAAKAYRTLVRIITKTLPRRNPNSLMAANVDILIAKRNAGTATDADELTVMATAASLAR